MSLIEPSNALEAVEEEAAVEEEEAVEDNHCHPFHRKPSNQFPAPQMYERWESCQKTSTATAPKEKTSSKNVKDTGYERGRIGI
jgi:hypothetical protein